MPKAVTKSGGGVLGKLGSKLKESHEKHKDDEVKYGNVNLPDGVNGIAKLTELRFATYDKGVNKGKPYFMGVGIVVSPESHNGLPIKGLRTSIMENLHDTPKRTRESFDDHWAWVENELKKLGAPMAELEGQGDAIEAACKDLVDEGVHFRFHTWKGEPQKTGPYAGKESRVAHFWDGAVENYVAEEGEAVEDSTGEATTTTEGEVTEETETETEVTEAVVETETEGGDDLDDLASKADKNDRSAAERLEKLASEAGIDKKKVATAKNWTAVAKLIKDAAPTETTEETTEEVVEETVESSDPAVEQVYFYSPLDKTTKRPGKKVECEVMEVDDKKKTVSLKNLDDKKTLYKGVPWSKLEEG